MVDVAHRAQLGSFLRSRRERLTPVEVGLAPGPRRRTPGLRREEVAQLSGVSMTWYTWLEQGRDITVSRQVLESLATALRLGPTEHQHLLNLAGQPTSAPTTAPPRPPNPTLQALVDALHPHPAYLLDPCWNLLGWNRAEAALIGDPARLDASARNIIWMLFTDPAMRRLVCDWAGEAQRLLAQYRAAAAEHAGDPRFEQLTTALHEASPHFRKWWSRHDIAAFQPARKRFDHPRLGLLTLDFVKLVPAEESEIKLLTYLPSDAATAAKLPELAVG